MSRLFILLLVVLFLSSPVQGQTPSDLAVPVKVATGINPPAVLINWTNPAPSDVVLRRRTKGQPGNAWIELVNAPATLLDGYFDFGVDGAETYEYELQRKTGNTTAYGYAFANFFAPAIDNRGKLLVFIDSTTADQLGADLITYKNDLRGEGWQTVPIKTGNYTTVQWVKNKIISAYNADPGNVKAVLLIGNVPIPYSGSTAWDNQADHVGAWPCDAYYGDVDGQWTDNSVNITNTARQANRNVPGDGKFDQNTLPSAVELAVGRLDFRRLSSGTFGAPPVELLRQYLLKNHQYRNGRFKVPNKAIVDDNLGWSNGEAFAADGFRNAYPLTGATGVVQGDYLAQTNPQQFIMGFGAGSSGTYSSAGGVATVADIASDTVNVVFSSLFGNYFGDWDFESNPLMPALIASKGRALACLWAGRPHSFQHGLASGETIGYCLKETQNAQYNTAYGTSNAESGAHIALIGDPTLRAQVVSPVADLSAVSNCTKVNLHWTAAPDSGTLGYLVYRSFSLDGPYQRVSPDLITETSWADNTPVADTLYYAVRAIKLEVTPGGGAFYNASTSQIKSVIFVPGTGPTAIGLGGTLTCSHPDHILGTNFQPPTSTWQWYKPNGQPLNGYTATEGGVYTVVVTAPNGCTVAAYATVNMDTLLPVVDLQPQVIVNCISPSQDFIVPAAPPGVQYTYNGVPAAPGASIPLTQDFTFTVSSTNNGCSHTYNVDVVEDITQPVLLIINNGLVLNCGQSSVDLTANTNGLPVSYAWEGNGETAVSQTLNVTAPGAYCCTVTGANGCTSSNCATVTAVGTVVSVELLFQGDPCGNGEKILTAQATGGAGAYQYLWSNGVTTATNILAANFAGTMTVTVTDAGNCQGTLTTVVGPPPAALALTDKPSTSTVADGSIDLIITGGLAPFTFNWSNGNTTEDVSSLVSGIYTVTITGANGCSVVQTIPLITVGTTEQAGPIKISFSPNPVADHLQVTVDVPSGAEMQLVLTDLSGKWWAQQRMQGSKADFELAHVPSGLYLMWVQGDFGATAFKVVVAH